MKRSWLRVYGYEVGLVDCLVLANGGPALFRELPLAYSAESALLACHHLLGRIVMYAPAVMHNLGLLIYFGL